MKRFVVMALLCLSLETGCKYGATNPASLAPGAMNAFDQDSYQALMASQGVLNSLRSDNLTQIKAELNDAILSYDAAEIAYQTYHAALVAGKPASTASVSTALSNLQSQISAVQQAAAGVKQ